MAIRIKWDKYETALLIDGFWKIEKSPEKKKEIIAELSASLRARAVNLGIDIDDVFRNVNGISMQLSPIAHAFFPDRPTLTTSAMFEEMVELYKTNRPAFDEILSVAKSQVGGKAQMNVDLDKRVSFITWLSSNCPKDLSAQDIMKSLEDGSQRSIKSRYSDKSFWEMSSNEEFSKVTDRLLSSLKWSRFLISRKRAFSLLERSVELYKKFLSETTIIQKLQSDHPVEPVEEKRVFLKLDRTEAIYLIDTYVDTLAHKGDWGAVAREASRVFRARAQKFDVTFDEAFRNVPFIDECFSDIAKLFQNPDNDNCHPLLKELVSLYLKDPARYNLQSRIVSEELTKLGVLSTENKDNDTVINQQTEAVTPTESEKTVTISADNDSVEDTQEESAPIPDTENTSNTVQSIVVPTPSMDDSTYLADKLYLILKTESARNKYGSTLYYLSSLANAPQEKVKAILERSDWAQYQYGRYSFAEESNETEVKYDFASPQSLAYTKPTRLLYFDEEISVAATWRQLYLDFMKAINEDYPDTIRDILGKTYSPSSSPLVDSATEIKRFRAPGEFAPGLIIELNRSASNIVNCIEKLLELCNVDCENVQIFFERKQTPVVKQADKIPTEEIAEKEEAPRQVSGTTERRYLRDDKEDFYRWLKEDQKLAEATCAGYVSAIRGAEDYAIKSLSSACKLFCDNKEIIEFTARTLFADEFFKKRNEQQHNRFFAALRKYLEYKQITTNDNNDPEQTVIESVDEENKVRDGNVLSTLKEHFVYGFNISSPIEMMRFRAHYEADHNEQCAYDDEALRTEISSCGLPYKGKIYVVEQEIKDRIRSLIIERIQFGDFIFYYDKIYTRNEDWLYDGHIIDSDMLKVLLEKVFPRYQYKDRYFLVRNTRISEINTLKEAILHCWGDQVLHTFAELQELLPFIPLDKIRYALSYSKEFTWNSLETYARNDLFVVSDEQIQELVSVVEAKCAESGSVTFDDLPLEEIAAENYDLSETALFEIIFSYLPDSFSRNGRVISKTSEQQHDTVAAIQQYCKAHETCTMAELQQIMQDVEGSVRYPVVIEAANAVMVRVSQDDFVTDDNVLFDVPGIDSALDNVVVGNGIGIKEVTTFGAFPFCGYSWNHFVLESYCRRFSAKYRYACMTPNSQNAGAIIRKNSDLSYHDIMAEALARSDVKLVEKDAFDYLITSGLLIRRRYSDMTALLQKAAALREGGD